MTGFKSVTQAQWSHHCYGCGDLFDAVALDDPCRQCGLCDRRETVSLDPDLHERYGIRTPEEWAAISRCKTRQDRVYGAELGFVDLPQ